MPALDHTYLCSGASLAGVACPSARSFSVQETGQAADTRGDNEPFHRATPITSVEETLEVECRDVSAAIKTGLTGATTLTNAKRASGLSNTGTLTATCASATVLSVTKTTDADGQPAIRVSLRINSPDGVSSGIVWSAT